MRLPPSLMRVLILIFICSYLQLLPVTITINLKLASILLLRTRLSGDIGDRFYEILRIIYCTFRFDVSSNLLPLAAISYHLLCHPRIDINFVTLFSLDFEVVFAAVLLIIPLGFDDVSFLLLVSETVDCCDLGRRRNSVWGIWTDGLVAVWLMGESLIFIMRFEGVMILGRDSNSRCFWWFWAERWSAEFGPGVAVHGLMISYYCKRPNFNTHNRFQATNKPAANMWPIQLSPLLNRFNPSITQYQLRQKLQTNYAKTITSLASNEITS